MGQQIRVLTDVLRSTPSTHMESFITGLEKTFNTFTLPIVYFKRQDKTRRTCTCGFSCVLQLQEADFLQGSLSSGANVLSIVQPCISYRDPTCLALLNTEFMVSV